MSDWIERLRTAGIPCSPVRNFEEVTRDPQTALRHMFPEINIAGNGTHRVTGPAIKLSATPARITTAAPGLGEHTALVLSELLGVNEEEIKRLTDARVIVPEAG